MIDGPTTALRDGAGHAEVTVLDAWTAGLRGGWAQRCRIGASIALGIDVGDVDASEWDGAQRAMLEFAGGRRGRVEAVAACARCGALADIELGLADLIADDVVEHRDDDTHPALRVPTVGDVVDAAGTASPAAAEALLAERCWLDDVPTSDRDGALAELDQHHPLLAPACTVSCPHCGADFDATLDGVELCWAAIEEAAAAAIDDVIALGSAFGWSEHDVLSIPPARRAAYRRLSEGRHQ